MCDTNPGIIDKTADCGINDNAPLVQTAFAVWHKGSIFAVAAVLSASGYRSCVLMPESFMNFASFVTPSIRS